MYDELIEELRRHHCDAKEDDTQEVCEECAYDVIIADKSVPSGIASVCVCGLMNRAADAIEELSKPKWIPVTERLPEPNVVDKYGFAKGYLVKTDRHVMMHTARYNGEWWILWGKAEVITDTVTHWMPLPEPPESEE